MTAPRSLARRIFALAAVPLAGLLAAAAPPKAPASAALRPLREVLSPERSRVGLIGPAPINPEEARRLIVGLAARETLRRGFDWFEPIGEPSEPPETRLGRDPRYRSGRPSPDLRLLWAEHCQDGWKSGPDPAVLCAGSAPLPAGGAMQATTQIMMGHGPAPHNDMAVSARAELRP